MQLVSVNRVGQVSVNAASRRGRRYDFTAGVLPAGVSFARASAGYRFNSAGLLVSEASDVPRLQYDPATLVSRGLLVEDARTNLFTKSEKFDDAAWTKTRASVSANTGVAPDGATAMDTLIEDSTATSTHLLSRGVSFVAGTSYVFSVFVKASGRTWLILTLPTTAFTLNYRANFDVTNGVLGTVSAGSTAFIQNVGGGIYRCSVIATATVTASASAQLNLTTGDGSLTYTGDGTSGLQLWGASIEAGDTTGTYISTDAAAVARAADVALVSNAAILSDQCYVLKARTPRRLSGGAVNVLMQIDDGTNNNNRRIVYGTDGRIHAIATVGGVDQCDLDLGAVAANTDFSVAARFADNAFAASLNGGAIVTDLVGVNPTGLTAARLGRRSDGYAWNSTIRSIETRAFASDADLPALAA